MALTENGTDTTMLVTPANGIAYGGNYGGGGLFGGGDSWLGILFLIALCNGGFGFGGGFGGGYGNMMLGYDFPWLLNGQNGINNNVSEGFRDAQLHDSITSVRDGISALATQLCNCCGDMTLNMSNGFAGVNQNLCSGFAGINAGINSAQNAIAQQLNTNELASLNRSFAEQTANMQGFNGIQSQIAQCCCDNRLGTESLRATVLQENCQDRYEASNNTRDIIQSQTSNTQAILDKLCALELDGYKRENDQLRTQLNMANLAASQTAQTAELRANNATVANQLVSELRSCPIPSQPVYGNQPIFTCQAQSNCGCGCGAF